MIEPPEVTFAGEHCTLRVRRPATALVVVTFTGQDTGEHGDRPFQELAPDVARGPLQLFIDARHARGATLDVSSEWARWLGQHRDAFRHVSMLTGSRFVQLSASFVRRFSDLGERMRVYTDPAAFEGALDSAILDARSAT